MNHRARHIALGLLGAAGLLLLAYSWPTRSFRTADVSADLQWLMAIALGLIGYLAVLWTSRASSATKMRWSLIGLSIWGTVSFGLILAGTDFPWNGFWGDQMFRIAMIRKFMTYGPINDFYYTGLPPFYPPLFFWVAAVLGKLSGASPHLALKLGTLLAYAVGPVAAYWLWRRSVSPLRAGCATILTFLIHPSIGLGAPHEFLAMSLFIPWWLAYVDGRSRPGRGFEWVWGGLLGGLLFMTYYYPFFIGGLALLWRWGQIASSRLRWRENKTAVLNGLAVLGVSAVASAVYWLPLLISMLTHDAHSSQNRWFHNGYANLGLIFTEFNWFGLLSLAGLVWIVAFRHKPVCGALIRLVGAILGVILIGSVLGNLDLPILYVKAKEFAYRLGGACAGLFVAHLLIVFRNGRFRTPLRAAVLLLLLLPLNEMARIVTMKPTELARSSRVRLTELSSTADLDGQVVLTDIIETPIFTPAHLFMSPGEHYSHPAGEFRQRLDFLLDLQEVGNPYLFWLGMRYNRWEPIDYLAAAGGGDPLRIRFNVCSYPDRFKSIYLNLPRKLVADSNLFEPVGSTRFVRLGAAATTPARLPLYQDWDEPAQEFRSARIRRQLTDEGRRLWDQALPTESESWQFGYDQPSRGAEFSDAISLVSVASQHRGDSIRVAFALRVTGAVKDEYRAFLHIYSRSDRAEFDNHDFGLPAASSSWRTGQIVILIRDLPLIDRIDRIHFGLFNDKGRLGEGMWCRLAPDQNIFE